MVIKLLSSMPRPRSVSDPQVFVAFSRAVGRLGPVGVTLADVAKEAGITASALAQRFGSKRALFAAFMRHELAAQPDRLARLDASTRTPLSALLGLAGGIEGYSTDRGIYLRHIASFMLELADDPEIQPVVRAWMEAECAWIAARLKDALATGALRPETHVPTLARLLQATLQGARFQWALAGAGEEHAWTRRQMEQVLKPWRI